MDSSPLLPARAVCARLAVSRSMLYKLHGTGRLRARYRLFDTDRGLRWTEEDVEAYLEAHPAGAAFPQMDRPPAIRQEKQEPRYVPLTMPKLSGTF